MTTPVPPKIFIDKSGSTDKQGHYWHALQQLLPKTGPAAQYFLFDEQCHPVTYDQVKAVAGACAGDNGTVIASIAPHVQPNDAIYIITDGCVGARDVIACDAFLNGMALKSVLVAFVQTYDGYGRANPMDLSVSAPFTRKTSGYTILKNGEVLATGRTDRDVDMAAYASMTPAVFITKAEELLKQVTLQNMGRTNMALRHQLLDLQKTLLARVAAEASAGLQDDFVRLRGVLAQSCDEGLAGLQRLLTRAGRNETGARIAGVFQELLRACDTKDFSFAALAPGRLERATAVVAPRTDALPDPEVAFDGFECPVTLDAAIPVCLVADGDPVLGRCEKRQLEAYMTNPLLVLLDPLLVAAVRDRLDHLVGLDTVKELQARSTQIVSPITRRPVAALLALGREREHVRATDHALAQLFFGKKLVGLSELWLAVVYFIVQDTVVYLREAAPFMAAFQDHLLHRMRTHHTNLTLSGLPIEPMLKAPVDVAVWYCAVSPFVWQTNASKDVECNRLRAFGPTARYLLRLLDALGYQYRKEELLHWCSLYKAFAWMMNEAKREDARKGKWLKLLCAQWQNSVQLPSMDGQIILLDGPATDETRPPLPDFAVVPGGPAPRLAELRALSLMVNAGKTVNGVFIPRELPLLPECRAVYHYAYPRGPRDATYAPPELSPATFRPVVMDRAQRKHWLECVQQRLGITNMHQQLSMYQYFIGYVAEHGAYPSRAAYIAYVATKQAAREDGGARETLPEHMVQYTDELFTNYERLLGAGFATVPPNIFAEVTRASMPRDKRAQLDGSDALLPQ